jgi:uncharacterized repeat protein (TIGR04138 family)
MQLANFPLLDTLPRVPSKHPANSLQEVVDAVGVYPMDAYLFVQQGLSYAVEKIHGEVAEPTANHHISGRDLCLGLRDVALERWGLLARTVLQRWNITTTLDFGRIVFAMIEHNYMQKTDQDRLDDFRQVYDFRTELESGYRIAALPAPDRATQAESKA